MRKSNSTGAAAAAAAAAPVRKRQRKAYAALTGPSKGLPEKLGAAPLRLILIGHNPSEHAWHTGHYYSNPSNRMWRILESAGITPPGVSGPEADDVMPAAVGVGFTDVGSGQPGTDSSLFTAADFQGWRAAFYARLAAHMKAASDSIGCSCGRCGAPRLVAFTGKRHYLELLNLDASGQQRRGKDRVASAAVKLGLQPQQQLPPGWPLPADKTEVWVLTSTSGAAPMSNQAREAPYRQLAQRLAQLPWPRSDIQLPCKPKPDQS
ncbi:hypothetical protein OEZ86_004062 [Tetradesmus obliquus]|nr:hypothetical protein OEZ86_004062 [Tetradesmus obliquus]